MPPNRARSPDFNVGDLAIMQNASFHPQFNGALAEIVEAERLRGSVTPTGESRPPEQLYRVRVVAPVDGEVVFCAAKYQLRPLDGDGFARQRTAARSRVGPEARLGPLSSLIHSGCG